MAVHPSNSHSFGPGITRIAVTGFKSLANKTDVEIRPLTVLAGANSSGKSSLMQPLLLMKQTLESRVVPAGPFLLSGPYTRYTQARQFLTRWEKIPDSPKQLTVEFEFGHLRTASMTYAVGADSALEVVVTRGGNRVNGDQWAINRNATSDYLKSNFSHVGVNAISLLAKGLSQFSVERHLFSHGIRVSAPADATSPIPSELYEMQEIQSLNFEILRLLYIPGLRGDQLRKWLPVEVSEFGVFEGPFESYVPSIIESWKRPNERPKLTALADELIRLDLAYGIDTTEGSESEIEVRVPRTPNSQGDDFVNVADVGLAVSTVLPVLVALIQADPGQLVYIEQPELHLHPRAQWKLAQLLALAADRGVQLVIETHSSLLLRGILTQVAENRIANDKVILHWFDRDKETGSSVVHPVVPDSAGRVGEWPEDFSDVELKSDNEYLNAAKKKLYAETK